VFRVLRAQLAQAQADINQISKANRRASVVEVPKQVGPKKGSTEWTKGEIRKTVAWMSPTVLTLMTLSVLSG